jgi:hypothetical protein
MGRKFGFGENLNFVRARRRKVFEVWRNLKEFGMGQFLKYGKHLIFKEFDMGRF